MANYLDDEYTAELISCIKNDKISDKMVNMFKVHCYNMLKVVYVDDPDIRDDMVSTAFMDLCQYYKTYKIRDNCGIKFIDNLSIGDCVRVNHNGTFYVAVCGDKPNINKNVFYIDPKLNRTLSNIKTIFDKYSNLFENTVYNTKHKLSIISLNDDDKIFVEIEVSNPDIIKPDKYETVTRIDNYFRYDTKKPSKAFFFMTTLIRNAYIRHLNSISKGVPRQNFVSDSVLKILLNSSNY
jgi:hypothetical protein